MDTLVARLGEVVAEEPAAPWVLEGALREALADFTRNGIGMARGEVARLTETTRALLDALCPGWQGVEFVHPLPGSQADFDSHAHGE